MRITKRQGVALRRALRQDSTDLVPLRIARQLAHKGLAEMTGYVHEPREWGRVVCRLHEVRLTDDGIAVARRLAARLEE